MADLRDKNGNLVESVDLPNEPAKMPALGKLGDVRFSVPPVISVFLGGTEKSKVRPVKAIVGHVTFTVVTPAGPANIVGHIVATRAEDTIDEQGRKRQNVSYETDFGQVGRYNGSPQLATADPIARNEWQQSLIADFREWRKAKHIAPPMLVVGTTGATFAD